MTPLVRLILAFIVGMPTSLAYAPFGYWPIALITPVFLLLLINKQSIVWGTLIAFAWAAGHFTTGTTWTYSTFRDYGDLSAFNATLATIGLVCYLALYPALFAAFLNGFFPKPNRRRFLIAAPIFWLINDWLRGYVSSGMPWLLLGYSQTDSPLRGYASISGVAAISFMILLSAGALTYAILHKNSRYSLITVAILVLGLILSNIHWVIPNPSSRTQFALIQPNIDLEEKFQRRNQEKINQIHQTLTDKHWDADIILWAETSLYGDLHDNRTFLKQIDEKARQTDTHVLVGILKTILVPNYYNGKKANSYSNYYGNRIVNLGGENTTPLNAESQPFDPEALPFYQKHNLFPFGEYVPLNAVFGETSPFFRLTDKPMVAGEEKQANLVAKGRHLLAVICYEVIFGEYIRKNMTDETNFIITLSNEAWFKGIGPFQHAQMARMRAIEQGKPVIRSSNDGVSLIIDYRGKIVAQLPRFESTSISKSVVSTVGNTPYYKFGEWLLYLWCILGLLYSASLKMQRR